MDPRLQISLRTLQTHAPFLAESRFRLQRTYRRALKRPLERDFESLRLLAPPADAVLLDVGGNRGQSIDALLICARQGTVHSFEPNPLLFAKLQKLFGDNPRVVLHNYGLGNRAGRFPLFVPRYRRYVFDGLASFRREDAEDWLPQSIYRFREENLTITEVECEVKRLDDLDLDPFFVKLDVQGFELPALEGARQTLAQSTPILMVETGESDEAITSFLRPLGYEALRYDAEGEILQRDDLPSLNRFYLTRDKIEQVEHQSPRA